MQNQTVDTFQSALVLKTELKSYRDVLASSSLDVSLADEVTKSYDHTEDGRMWFDGIGVEADSLLNNYVPQNKPLFCWNHCFTESQINPNILTLC